MPLAITTPAIVPTRSTVPASPVGVALGAAGSAVSMKLVQVAYDSSYPTGGETADFSSVFPTRILGAFIIAETLNDAGYDCRYVLGTAGDPATGVIQVYWQTDTATAVSVEVTNTTDISAMNGQIWLVIGY